MEDNGIEVDNIIDRVSRLENRPSAASLAKDRQEPDEVFRALADRVELLEAELVNERNAFMRKIAAYGGLVAVLISIGVGAATLVDRFHFDRLRAIQAQEAELNGIVSRLTEINWSLLELRNSPNAQLASDFYQIMNGEKAALLQRSGYLVEGLDEQISFPVAMALAYESFNFGDIAEANRFSQIALETAPNEGFRANAMAYLARTYAVQGPLFDLATARDLFGDAVAAADAMPTVAVVGYALPILTDWIVGEAYFGNCEMAQGLVAKAQERTVGLPNAAALQFEYFNTVRRRLEQLDPERCMITLP